MIWNPLVMILFPFTLFSKFEYAKCLQHSINVTQEFFFSHEWDVKHAHTTRCLVHSDTNTWEYSHTYYVYLKKRLATIKNKPEIERIIFAAADAAFNARMMLLMMTRITMRVLFRPFTESHVQIYIYKIWMRREKKRSFKGLTQSHVCENLAIPSEKKHAEWMVGKKWSAVLLRRMP